MTTLISREPWWASPPYPGQNELDLEWGYLEVYDSLEFRFVHVRPTDEEIINRKGCRTYVEPSPSA
ncbi:hypothetical protein IQ22_02288 [Pseudomonas duriflava]|uniref:Uncharacterized protein n=1 Tax=Pseudomonas duriflava TaxID=459528 RepID=A0A562QAD3_9PSED|nr:hypothetical protein [Pseudomonas duriflava]TWI53683.1 hypothetical protein IQ22_02288 [Pseudomonas duriflava]